MPEQQSEDLHELAFAKLSAILGEEVAVRVMARALAKIGIRRIVSVDDLYRFGQAVTAQGGFEGAAGSLLVLLAVGRGGGRAA